MVVGNLVESIARIHIVAAAHIQGCTLRAGVGIRIAVAVGSRAGHTVVAVVVDKTVARTELDKCRTAVGRTVAVEDTELNMHQIAVKNTHIAAVVDTVVVAAAAVVQTVEDSFHIVPAVVDIFHTTTEVVGWSVLVVLLVVAVVVDIFHTTTEVVGWSLVVVAPVRV